MKSMNKVQLIGYLGRNPEIKTLPGGNTFALLRMATNYYTRVKDSELKQHTDWHTIKLWGKKEVDRLSPALIKGSHILVDGMIAYRTYIDKDGHTRYITEITANYLVDLDR